MLSPTRAIITTWRIVPFHCARACARDYARACAIDQQPHRTEPTRNTMAAAKLFTPIKVGNVELRNRIVIAPMCQYSAVDGQMTDWHLIHLGHLALSGAALLTIEATAVVPEGRITYADVGLWSDETEGAIARTLESVRRWSDIPIAIQLAHAGRKASSEVPWKGGAHLAPDHP